MWTTLQQNFWLKAGAVVTLVSIKADAFMDHLPEIARVCSFFGGGLIGFVTFVNLLLVTYNSVLTRRIKLAELRKIERELGPG